MQVTLTLADGSTQTVTTAEEEIAAAGAAAGIDTRKGLPVWMIGVTCAALLVLGDC